MILNKIIRKLANFCGSATMKYDFTKILCNGETGEKVATNGKQIAILKEFENYEGEIQDGKTVVDPDILDRMFKDMYKAKHRNGFINISHKDGVNTYTPYKGEEVTEEIDTDKMYFPDYDKYIDRDKSQHKYLTVLLCPDALIRIGELMKAAGESTVRLNIPIETELEEKDDETIINVETFGAPVIFEQLKYKELVVHTMPMKQR